MCFINAEVTNSVKKCTPCVRVIDECVRVIGDSFCDFDNIIQ